MYTEFNSEFLYTKGMYTRLSLSAPWWNPSLFVGCASLSKGVKKSKIHSDYRFCILL